jgi:hypothetical protein
MLRCPSSGLLTKAELKELIELCVIKGSMELELVVRVE